MYAKDQDGALKAQEEQNPDWLEDERLLQAHKLAALGELSAGLAHEINNPLAVIRQEAELLGELLPLKVLETIPDGKDIRDGLREIIRQVDRCKSITHNLLNYARKNEPIIQAMDLNVIVEDMVRLVEKEAKCRNIVLTRDYSSDLPLILTDAPQLRQVMLNLLNNAIQSIDGQGEVVVGTMRNGSWNLEIQIRDTGCGIAPEYLDKIFDPFFTTKSPGQGTGLGLSISQKIITRLGGSIRVKSTLGRGSTFTVTLPINETRTNHAREHTCFDSR